MTSVDTPPPSATPAELANYFGIDVPFMTHIGLVPTSLGDGICVTTLPLRPELANSRGDVHGGTMMSALDFTLSAAARSHDPLRFGVVTVEFTTHFIDRAHTDLTIIGRCIRRGKSLAFCDGEVRDAQDQLVVTARAVFKLIARDRS
ncbi:PaaI family thioesterase [Burkholderia guangdongensis]|uniref:PaaI family thioesterase n=1 Tax=Burkholderia guangdongensis TaxID=1792500 RepID=UPI0015CE548F|nr:PaaI family thioesterase [Burkholderia guangdongensis]